MEVRACLCDRNRLGKREALISKFQNRSSDLDLWILTLMTDKRFVKKYTPPDFQAKNCAPLISPNFNSFGYKNGHILPTGQWYAPSAVINDALIMPEFARVCQSMPK